MDMKNLTSSALLCAAMGALLTLGSTLSAQIAPSWTSDFSQYANNYLLADKSTYSQSTRDWRLVSGNAADMPAGTGATIKTVGGLTFAQVSAAGNSASRNARIQTHNFDAIALSATQKTYIGGDVRYNGGGVAGTNATTAMMFTGRNAAGNSIQISMGINFSSSVLTFFANFNNTTVPAESVSFNAGPEIAVNPNAWYTFAAVIAPETGITDLQVLAGNEVVWSITTSGNVVPVEFTAVEMQVTRPGSTGLRTADFANLTIGTQIPEPATTAALLLLAAFGATVVLRRRRK